MINKKNINFVLSKENLTIIFFVVIFVIGLVSFKDFNLYGDEPVHQWIGSIYYAHIKELIFNFNPDNQYLDEIKKLSTHEYFFRWVKYGIFFDLITGFFKDIFNIKTTKALFELRHFVNFSFFFISLIFFFKIINLRFDNFFLSILSVVLLFFSPRIFAGSFYNSKDLLFLSFSIINVYFALKFIDKQNINNLILFSLSSGILLNIRIMGLIFLLLTFSIILFEVLEKENLFIGRLKNIFFSTFLTFFIAILFWPYFWFDPLNNFFHYIDFLKELSVFTNLYLGEIILSDQMPWHYLLVWISITVPTAILFLSILGLITIFLKICKNILQIDKNNELWFSTSERSDFFIFFLFFVPVLAAQIYKHKYDGWTHLYFIYPFMIYYVVYILDFFKTLNYKLFLVVIFFTIVNIAININWIIKYHPHQYAYFNYLGKVINKKFDLDLKSLSVRSSLEYILNNSNEEIIKVSGLGNTWIEGSASILGEQSQKKFMFVDPKEANYLITTFKPMTGKKIIIDTDKFSKYYDLVIDNNIVSSIYKRKIK